jgi:ABC-2 type transport system permease protein
VLLPLSFLSGALYPIDNLPRWLHTLVMLNPVTYAVHAVRTTVFHYLDAPQAAKDALNPPLTWNGWVVPMGVQLGVVIVLGLGLMALAAKQFEKAE